MKSSINVLLIFCFSTLGLASCSREKEFELVVINATDYHLDQVDFGCATKKEIIEVAPNSVSDTFIIQYKEPLLPVTQPLLCLGVSLYSDTLTTYKNKYGGVVPYSDLEEGEVNMVKIGLDPSPYYPTDIFIISVNE